MLYWLFRSFYFIVTGIDLVCIILFATLASFLPICISKYYMHFLFNQMCWAFVRFLGFDVHIHHKYTGKLPERYILITNHPSGADIILANALFRVYPLAKEGVKEWWFLGRIAKAAGIAFVVREDKDSRQKAKQVLLDYVQKDKKNLLIYPEGGCFGKHLRPFKYGAFDISIQSKVPILPVYFQYEAENAFEWGDFGLVKHLWYLLTAPNKHVHCYILPPIVPEESGDPQVFCDTVHQQFEMCEQKYRNF